VKKNQPTLHERLRTLPWERVTTKFCDRSQGHGRMETRVVQMLNVDDLDFPYVAQVAKITRHRTSVKTRKRTRETVYMITDLTGRQASPEKIARLVRSQWVIENRRHFIRDAAFGEDRSPVRTGHGPENMATLRNLAINKLREHGHSDVAAGPARHPTNPSAAPSTSSASLRDQQQCKDQTTLEPPFGPCPLAEERAHAGAWFGVSEATAWRYVDETVEVLAAWAPGLHLVGLGEGDFVIVDATLIPTDRVRADEPYYSQKHKKHGTNVQVVARPDGTPPRFSRATPGRTHDLTAARAHGIVHPADPHPGRRAYQGASATVRTPYYGHRELLDHYQQYNRDHARLRAPGEHAFARLKPWRLLRQARCPTNRIGRHSKSWVMKSPCTWYRTRCCEAQATLLGGPQRRKQTWGLQPAPLRSGRLFLRSCGGYSRLIPRTGRTTLVLADELRSST
jgi:predicted transposase YbfD/YdcC